MTIGGLSCRTHVRSPHLQPSVLRRPAPEVEVAAVANAVALLIASKLPTRFTGAERRSEKRGDERQATRSAGVCRGGSGAASLSDAAAWPLSAHGAGLHGGLAHRHSPRACIPAPMNGTPPGSTPGASSAPPALRWSGRVSPSHPSGGGEGAGRGTRCTSAGGFPSRGSPVREEERVRWAVCDRHGTGQPCRASSDLDLDGLVSVAVLPGSLLTVDKHLAIDLRAGRTRL